MSRDPFDKLLSATLCLTPASLILAAILAQIWNEPTAQQESIIEACSMAWQTGFGIIIGHSGKSA